MTAGKDAPFDYDKWQRDLETLRAEHQVIVSGNVWWNWACSCGKSGRPTTQGRAAAGRDRHLTAERKRIATRPIPPAEKETQ